MSTTAVTIKLDDSLLDWIDAMGSNRTRVISDILGKAKDEMQSRSRRKPSAKRKAGNMRDLVNEAIMERMGRDTSYISSLSDEEFAKLVVSRLPKEEIPDEAKDAELLSLQSCIEALPSMGDVTQELNEAKSEIFRLGCKLKHYGMLEKAIKKDVKLREFVYEVYVGAAEYVAQKVIREGIAGIGEGGGLNESQLQEIKEHVMHLVGEM